MSIAFTAGELINIAMGIERSGIMFFDIAARTTDNAEAREIFERFVDMEREHLNTFEGMQADNPQFETAPGPDYQGYLQALIDGAVFTNDALMSDAVNEADSDLKALEIGINAEKDSILFYYAIKEVMPAGALPAIDKILSEEKSHLQQLIALKKKLESGEA